MVKINAKISILQHSNTPLLHCINGNPFASNKYFSINLSLTGRRLLRGFIDDLGDIFNLHIAVFVPDAVAEHGDAERTGRRHPGRPRCNHLVSTLVINAFADVFFHEHPGAAGAAA